ncbi:glycoside hydrolase domain-containing protein [Acidipila rosea]|nr:glycoside hydrolase domain-containing protein [Acidipila rosea]
MMRHFAWALLLLLGVSAARAQKSYLGFDQNLYPGDAALTKLHRTFSYACYWLNNPPQMNTNPWTGKRGLLRAQGFGFLLLFNGRLDAQLKGRDATTLGGADGAAAVKAALDEGFPMRAVIFLDQEEGGRMLPEQAAYLRGWIDAVRRGGFRAGVYCSGISVPEGDGSISTAQDVHHQFPKAALWVANDACPPSPGCRLRAAPPAGSGFAGAEVWQFAQSPRRPQYTAACVKTYSADGNCYAPGLPQTAQSLLDLDTAASADPSAGR